MTAILPKHKLCYVSAPKCASSALIAFMFEVENGYELKPFFVNGERIGGHQLYKSVPFKKAGVPMESGWRRLCVVRDPIGRMTSTYRGMVVSRKVLEAAFEKHSNNASVGILSRARFNVARRTAIRAFLAGEIPTQPTFAEFVERLDEYRLISHNIRHHSHPLSYFLGQKPEVYDDVFDISELDKFEDRVVSITGTQARIKKKNQSSRKIEAVMDDATAERIKTRFAEDYQIFGKWFAAASEKSLSPATAAST